MSSNSRPTIFLSYAHQDQARAQKLAAALERVGYTVWWDALIEGGTRFSKSIEEALQTADAIIVLWSRHSVESDWVRDEAAQGRDRHRLVPLSLDSTPAPLGFRQIQIIDFSRWRGRADGAEITAVRRAVEAAVGNKPTPELAAKTPSLSRRQALVGAGAAAGIAGASGLIAWKTGALGDAGPTERSIAVLPFANLSAEPEQAFLSEGLTEEVRSALTRNAGLLVLAATSSNTVGEDRSDARSIARNFGVAYLLDGSVQRSGNRVRIATNLTNGKTGFSEWSQRIERDVRDIFAIQSEVAASVLRALSVRIAVDDPSAGGTRNPAAYEAYLRGKSLYNLAKDEATDRQARADFEIAIAADPKFALAHAALARVLASIASNSAEASELKALYSASVASAERAIQLAPTRPEGHLALGYARFAGFLDVKGARPSYDRAYRYGRGDADIVLLYALFTARTRRLAEARAAIARALALDPLNPRTHRAAGTVAFASRRYEDAISHYRRALQLNPKLSNANAFIGDSLLMLGRLDEARAAYLAEPAAMFRLRGLAIVEHKRGLRGPAEQALAELVREEGDAAMYQQAEVMAQWGRKDEAFARLERAREIGDSGLSLIATDPLLDPIAADPRYRAFVRRIGFA